MCLAQQLTEVQSVTATAHPLTTTGAADTKMYISTRVPMFTFSVHTIVFLVVGVRALKDL